MTFLLELLWIYMALQVPPSNLGDCKKEVGSYNGNGWYKNSITLKNEFNMHLGSFGFYVRPIPG